MGRRKACWMALIAASGLPSIPRAARAATIRVPAERPTIQGAIETAADGDTVRVAPGGHGRAPSAEEAAEHHRAAGPPR